MAKKGPGRKNRYSEYVQPKLDLIAQWCRNGATENEIAKKVGVSLSTFNVYKNDHPELKEALRLGKQDAIEQVEAALFKRTQGYEVEEITYEQGAEVKRVKKHIPPDNTAIIFFLKNVSPDKWRDRQELKMSGNTGVTIINDIPRER